MPSPRTTTATAFTDLTPARTSARRPGARLLVTSRSGHLAHHTLDALPELLEPGDLLVLNDAGTLPASLRGRVESTGEAVELRLAASLNASHASLRRWVVVAMGAGLWRQPTEERPPPPRLEPGAIVRFEAGLTATVEARLHPAGRLLEVRLDADDDDRWRALYAAGRPIQYAYHKDALAVWDHQTLIAGAPIALEPPSSGLHLTWGLLKRLRRRGVGLAPISHGTGLSTTGDDDLDAILPLPELTYISEAAATLIGATTGRVVAVGTGAVRALESATGEDGALTTGWTTSLGRLDAGTPLRTVDGLLTGLHPPDTSHARLLAAFIGRAMVERSWGEAVAGRYLGHEYGDMGLVWR